MNSLSRIWDIPLLLLLSLIWASAFTMIKIAVPLIGPVLLVLIRCGIGAAVMLVLVALMRGASWPKSWQQWLGLIGLGIISTAVPFYLISFAEQKITSAMTAILMTTGPLVAIVLAHFFTDDEKINRGKIIGIGIGLIAALYLLKDGFTAVDGAGIWHPLAAMGAATCYAIGGLGAKKLVDVSAEVIAAMVLVSSAVVMLPFIPAVDINLSMITTDVWLALIWLGVMPSGLAFYLRYFLIKRNGYGFVSYVGYLIPLFAIVIGMALLDEVVTIDTILAMMVIILGLFFTRAADDLPWSLTGRLRQIRNHIG